MLLGQWGKFQVLKKHWRIHIKINCFSSKKKLDYYYFCHPDFSLLFLMLQ